MRIVDIFKFSLRLLKTKKARSFLIIFSIFVSTGVFFVFTSFSQGVEKALLRPILETSLPDSLIVRNNYFSLDFLSNSEEGKLNQKVIDKIKNFPESKSISRVLTLKFPSSLRISIFGFSFDTDSPIFGVDPALLEKKSENFKEKDEIIPTAISPRLIDLFNSSFAESVPGISHLESDQFIDKNLEIIFGKSTFLQFNVKEPLKKKAKIKVISSKIPPIGLSVPMESAFEVLKHMGGFEKDKIAFSQVFIQAKNPKQLPVLKNKINDLGFKAKTFEEIGEEILSLTTIFSLTLLIASFLFIFIALVLLFSMISISVLEQKQTIGILKALGESKKNVMLIFIFKAIILSSLATLIGILLGILASKFFDNFLLTKFPDVSFKPDTFFPFSIKQIIYIAFSMLSFSILSAFLASWKVVNYNILRDD